MGADGSQTATLIPVEQDTISFHGHELVAVRLDDGRIAAVLRWLFDSLGLERTAQIRRIERKTALREGLVTVRVDTEGGAQDMQALTLDVLPGYLYGIDESRVRDEVRGDIVMFQRECTRVLAEHFARKHGQPSLPAPADPAAAAIVSQIADLAATMNLLREHLEALQGLPQQVGHVAEVVEALAERQSATEAQVAQLDTRTDRLSPAQAQNVREMVDRMVRETKNAAQPLTHQTVYGRIAHRFRVNSYTAIRQGQYEQVLAFLRSELERATGGNAPQQGQMF